MTGSEPVWKGFTGFYWVSLGFLRDSKGFDFDFPYCAVFHLDVLALNGFSLAFTRFLLGFDGFHWVLLGSPAISKLLMGFAGLLLDLIGFDCISLFFFSRLDQDWLTCTGFLLGSTGFLMGFYWVSKLLCLAFTRERERAASRSS